MCLPTILISPRTFTAVLAVIVGVFTIWRGVSYYLNRRSLRSERDWLELQETGIAKDFDKLIQEWKKRGLPYPWEHIDQKNERQRTKNHIRELEQINDRNQFLLILAVGILGIAIAVLSYLFG